MNSKKRGPIVVVGILGVLVLAFLIISAIVNMPASDSLGGIGWGLIIGSAGIALTRFNRFIPDFTPRFTVSHRFIASETDEIVLDEPEKVTPRKRPNETHGAVNDTAVSDEMLMKLFGTTDVSIVSSSIETMYGELSQLRSQVKRSGHDESGMKRLKRERDEALQQVENISQRLASAERQAIQLVGSQDLINFFESIVIKDGDKEDAILKSGRRQRRFTQRLRAEGYCIAIAPTRPSPHV